MLSVKTEAFRTASQRSGMNNISGIIQNIAGGSSSAHAYIVEGRAGSGRDAFIKKLSMGLECLESDVTVRPCGKCPACLQAAAGSSMDIVRMQKSGKTSYKTEDANAFASRLDMGAYGRFLIGIIDDADSLSEAVQNKLLKTLEEPSEGTILLLGTSNRDHLLSTVKSRCSVIRLQDFDGVETEADGSAEEAVAEAASMLGSEVDFYAFRDAVDKSIKTRADALSLIDLAEDGFRERMLAGDEPAVMAASLAACETARADIEREMDRSKALKRLFLELSGR